MVSSGFILGPSGLINHEYKELTGDIIDEYRNTGGFDIIDLVEPNWKLRNSSTRDLKY